MDKTFDRAAEDLGNSIHLEHVNVNIPDQRLTTLFYGAGLGLTRDPNPVGFGILAFLSFWPSVILMTVGLGVCIARRA